MEIQFETLDYGNYVLEDDNKLLPIVENVKYDTADFNKLYVRRVKLPDGQANVIYLMSDSFDHALEMIDSQKMYVVPSYRRVYYPQLSFGTFMKKRYRLNIVKQYKDRNALIKSKTKKTPYIGKRLPKQYQDNIFVVASDLYSIVQPIVQKVSTKRAYSEFIPEFVSLLQGFTPDKSKNEKPNSNNRILVIDAENFAFKNGASLKDNKTNPLYLIYLAYLREKDLSKLNVDIDMLICARNMFMKFNPSKLTADKWALFRRFLFRIMNVNLDDYTNNLSEEDKKELEESAEDRSVNNIVNNAVAPYTKNVSGATKVALQTAVQDKLRKEATKKADINEEINKATGEKPINDVRPRSVVNSNPVKDRLSKQQEQFFKAMGTYTSLTQSPNMEVDDDEYEEWEDEIKDDAIEIIHDEEVAEEVLDEIQDNVVPLKKEYSPVNSKRDQKLREEQKKVVVGTETIEQILERDAANVPIKSDDKSTVMHTSNQNMTKITFANFDKTYIDELYMKDIVSCFDMLKDKDNPFFITNVEIHDTSTALDYKDTWTITLRDEVNKRHVVKVDIPKFQNDRFMLINGTRFIILKQNFYNPLVKDTPDTVIITTNYNKVTVTRRAIKSLSSIERIFSLIKKTGDDKMFVAGDSSKINVRYLSSLEFDELGGKLFSFKSGNCELFFSRKYIEENILPNVKTVLNDDEFVIGHEGDKAIIINEDTGLDRNGRTIIQIIEDHLPDEYKDIYNGIKGPSQSMYSEAKMAGIFVPVIAILVVWIGLSNTLRMMGINWNFNKDMKRVPKDVTNKKFIRFANGILEYDAKTYAELILNGLAKMHPETYQFEDFDNETGYEEFIYSQWGSYNGINELVNFNEFLIDPITEQVCKDMMLPSTAPGLLIHAVKLLSDNAFVSKASDKSYRVRSIEMIPAILYGCLAAQYKAYVKSGRKVPMTLNQRCVMQKLLAEKTVEPYSTLNPVSEVAKTHSISTKGYKGSNSEHSYDEEKRSYDPTAVGKIAITSSPDKNIGINRSLVIEPTIVNARGYRDQSKELDDLLDVNVFAPTEMLTPGTIRSDDPIRSAINISCGGKTI